MPSPLFSRTRWRPLAAPLAAYAVLWALMTWPQVLSWRLVGDLGDPLGKMWQLDWVAHALRHDPARLFDGNVFHPAATVLAYSDTMLVPSLLAAPLIWLGAPVAFAFNLLMAGGFIGSGLAMFLLVRRLTGSMAAAWVAGAAFAFLPYRFTHYSHLELQFTMWMPLAVWALDRAVESRRWRDGLLVGLLVGLQLLSSLYYGVFLGVVLVPVALVLTAGGRRPLKTLGVLAAGALVAAALAAPVVAAHARARTDVGERYRSDVLHGSARPADYLKPNVGNRTYPALADWDGQPERRLFPGFLLMVLAGLGVWPARRVPWVAVVVGALVAFDASRGLHGTVYRLLWDHVTLFGGFRVPARFGLLAAMLLTVLAGWGVARLVAPLRVTRWRGVLAACLIAGVLAESWTSPLPLSTLPRRVPDVYTWLARQPPLAALELPMDERSDFGYMYYATVHRQRIVNGQSGFFPPWYAELNRLAGEFPSDDGLRFLRARGVTHVVLHRRLLGDDRYVALTAGLEARADVRRVYSQPEGRPQADVWLIAPTRP